MGFRLFSRLALLTGVSGLSAGCVSSPAERPIQPSVVTSVTEKSALPMIQQTSYVAPVTVLSAIGDQKELTLATLEKAILERNPTLEQMRSAAEAAQMRYPQVISLDDPMFGVTMAPASTWSPHADIAMRGEITQRLPFPGKRALRGQMALAEAAAAGRDVDDVRLQLLESGRSAYADYFLVEKALEVNAENTKLMKEFRSNAETRYRNGQAPQQDILQADVELARQQERGIALQRARKVAQAKLNTLMHQKPDEQLPPPAGLQEESSLPEATVLREQALANRPDLKALSDRLAADEAALALTEREYKPDVELLAAYDSFWQGSDSRPLQWQIGAKINLPVRRDRRHAAVAEARAKINQRRAELVKASDQVLLQVTEAFEQYQESIKIVDLYEKTVLPTALANVKEAQVSYTNGKIPFLSLVEAQRNRVMLRDRLYEAQADTVRRRGTLERVVGGF